MPRGGSSPGAPPTTFPIAADTLEQWSGSAGPGDRIVYAHGREALPEHATFKLAVALTRQHIVTTHLVRRDDGGFDFLAVRRWPDPIRPEPARHAIPNDEEDVDQMVFRALRRAARLGLVCPTNAEIARSCGLKNADAASWRIRKLIAAKLIRVEDCGPMQRRIVTILASGKRTVAGAL